MNSDVLKSYTKRLMNDWDFLKEQFIIAMKTPDQEAAGANLACQMAALKAEDKKADCEAVWNFLIETCRTHIFEEEKNMIRRLGPQFNIGWEPEDET